MYFTAPMIKPDVCVLRLQYTIRIDCVNQDVSKKVSSLRANQW